MKAFERLTRNIAFRTGIAIFFGAILYFALVSKSARHVGLSVLAAMAGGVAKATPATVEKGAAEIRPFRVNVPEADLAELRRRLAATRWPDRETRIAARRPLISGPQSPLQHDGNEPLDRT
jgi:hypothetical protein